MDCQSNIEADAVGRPGPLGPTEPHIPLSLPHQRSCPKEEQVVAGTKEVCKMSVGSN